MLGQSWCDNIYKDLDFISTVFLVTNTSHVESSAWHSSMVSSWHPKLSCHTSLSHGSSNSTNICRTSQRQRRFCLSHLNFKPFSLQWQWSLLCSVLCCLLVPLELELVVVVVYYPWCPRDIGPWSWGRECQLLIFVWPLSPSPSASPWPASMPQTLLHLYCILISSSWQGHAPAS